MPRVRATALVALATAAAAFQRPHHALRQPSRRAADDDFDFDAAFKARVEEVQQLDVAAAVFGEGSANYPAVLGAMAAAYEAEATGEEVSARMRSLVQGWAASNGEMLKQCVAVLPQEHLKEKAQKMATA